MAQPLKAQIKTVDMEEDMEKDVIEYAIRSTLRLGSRDRQKGLSVRSTSSAVGSAAIRRAELAPRHHGDVSASEAARMYVTLAPPK